MTGFSMESYLTGVRERHNEAVALGLHDDECEWATNFFICHCSKRRREAQGIITTPTEDLYFPPPDCPRCSGDLEFDGDHWACWTCALAWAASGAASTARFTDDHGDLSRCAEHQIRRHVICQKNVGVQS